MSEQRVASGQRGASKLGQPGLASQQHSGCREKDIGATATAPRTWSLPHKDHNQEEEARASPALGEMELGAHGCVPVRHSENGSEEGWWRAGTVGHMDICPGCLFLG